MKNTQKRNLLLSLILLAAFLLWTVLLRFVDVQPIGPEGSSVGFAAMNHAVHTLFGVHLSLYNITDWLGYLPIPVLLGCFVFILVQWGKRKDIKKVDQNLLVLGVCYLVLIAVYLLFEKVVVNYRPILIEGKLEASYPSSTTLLVLSVMPTFLMQMNARIKREGLRKLAAVIILAFTVFMVGGRLISGVHWLSDIIGGALFSSVLILMYRALAKFEK